VIVPDINVLIYAFRDDMPDHLRYRRWLLETLAADEPVAVPGHVVSGFMRIVTNPRVFAPATPPAEAVRFVEAVRAAPGVVETRLAGSHVDTFLRLCVEVNAKGNLVADAYLAAVAIELDALLVTTDRDFARFPGLRWRHPLV
jgi:toxin-antitoxin system PIN domain toxin